MKKITQNGKEIYQTNNSYVSYPDLYEIVTGKKADLKEYKTTGNLAGVSYTDFIEENNLDVECWDRLKKY